jgi:hypothetical protein
VLGAIVDFLSEMPLSRTVLRGEEIESIIGIEFGFGFINSVDPF